MLIHIDVHYINGLGFLLLTCPQVFIKKATDIFITPF